MSLSTNLITTARTLLADYGESITLTRESEGTYSPTDGSFSGASSSSYSADGLPTQYSKFEIDETLVKSSDIRLILEKPTSVTPAVGDKCTIGGVEYAALNVTPIRAQGTDIIYILQLRQ